MSFLTGAALLCAVAVAGASSSCPENTCHQSRPQGTEHSLNVPWQLRHFEDFAVEPTLLDLLNKQINLELQAFYTYLSMATFFDRDDVAMSGFQRFFKAAAEEEYGHATQMMAFVNERGGGVTFGSLVSPCRNSLLDIDRDVPAGGPHASCNSVNAKYGTTDSTRPTNAGHQACDWRDPVTAVVAARQVELNVWRHLKHVHRHADKGGDVNTIDFLEPFIKEGQESTKQLSDLLTRLRRVQPCLGFHLIDQELQGPK